MNGSGTAYGLSYNWSVDDSLLLTITIHGNGTQSQNFLAILSILSDIYVYGTGLTAENIKVRVHNQGTDAARVQDLFERNYGICLVITLDWKFINA